MTERGILFSAPMVRALLDGSKTQTRRVVKGEMLSNLGDLPHVPDWITAEVPRLCPYGQPGDRLWVRETWHPDPEDDGTWAYTQWTGCKGSPLADIPKRFQKPEHCIHRASWDGVELVWRPSIHMPRWASRIVLEITGVRVERLQGISEADAIAEGCSGYRPDDDPFRDVEPRDEYRELWGSINGAGSWDANPWVWVVEFKRAQP